MHAIYFIDGVYITDNSGLRPLDKDSLLKESLLVYESDLKNRVYLYGGRVQLYRYSSHDIFLQIDGEYIEKISISDDGKISNSSYITMERCTAFLNEIENLGLDTFFNNYREQVNILKTEIADQISKIETEQVDHFDEEKMKLLDNLRQALRVLSCILFNLAVHLYASIDNHVYTDAYDKIMNLYY